MSGEKNRGKQTGRTLEMLAAMMTGDRLYSGNASERFQMNPEGALRNLKLLHKLVPGVVKTEEGQRHVFSFDPKEAFGTDPLLDVQSSLASAIAVTLGSAFSRVFAGTQYEQDLRRLRDEVVQRLSRVWKQRFVAMSRKFVVLGGREEELADRAELLDDVLDALFRQRPIRIKYRKFSGKEDETVVEPYSLVIHDAHLYVLGKPGGAGSDELHPYRFARIQALDVLDTTFTYPEPNQYDPSVVFRDSIGIWTGGPAPCAIRVRLSPLWGVYARHHRWHESQKVVAESDDGSVDIEMRVRPCPEFEQWILRFGEHAEVLTPESLRETLRRRSRALAAVYRDVD